jgi:4-deoxy-L-threo-5-hexosulose-uronate ketol-isomerase
METRTTPDDVTYARMTTEELRRAFLFENLFEPGRVSMVYCDADRAIVGAAVPLVRALSLEATRREMAAEYFTERREVGVVNVGGGGRVVTGEAPYPLPAGDVLYLGKGVKEIRFESDDPARPAQFYFVSFPAHATFPTALARRAEAETSPLGSAAEANVRTIRRYIHAGGVRSCQLVMGITELDEGSVWNTMPPHTHVRRTEVYMYFGLPADAVAMHIMGRPDETRSLVVRDRQAVLSPGWSIHAAAGTRHYSFAWAMGGENQEFSDMDSVNMQEMK